MLDAGDQRPVRFVQSTPLDCAHARLRYLAFCADLELRIRVADPRVLWMPRLGAML